MGVGIFWIGLNWADLGCWRLTLNKIVKLQQSKKPENKDKGGFLV